ncbi:hypothetical protein P4S68_17325 [Pseudoalteromonas sp. Hal099]
MVSCCRARFCRLCKSKPNTGYVIYECFEGATSNEIIKKGRL